MSDRVFNLIFCLNELALPFFRHKYAEMQKDKKMFFAATKIAVLAFVILAIYNHKNGLKRVQNTGMVSMYFRL